MSITADQQKIWDLVTNSPGTYYCQASDQEREQFRDWVLGLLREQEVLVDFVKADGDFRSMKCTLSESLGAKYSSNGSKKKPNPDVCVVWDTSQGAWRSFRWDRVKKVQLDIG